MGLYWKSQRPSIRWLRWIWTCIWQLLQQILKAQSTSRICEICNTLRITAIVPIQAT